MKKSLKLKLEQMLERFHEVEQLLSDLSIISNQDKFKLLSMFARNDAQRD